MVGTIRKHKKCGKKPYATCTIILCIYLFICGRISGNLLCSLPFVTQVNGRDRATVFVSPPPGVEWPQGADPTTQTSVKIEDEDINWVVLRAGEDAAAKAASKRPAAPKQSKKRSVTTLLTGGALSINEPEEDPEDNPANKHRHAIFAWPDDDAEEGEDADTFQLVPQKRRKQLESMEQDGSSTPVGPTSPTAVKDAAGSTSRVPGQGTRPAMGATTQPCTPPTIATRRTSGRGVEHQGPATVLDVEGDQGSSA